MARGDMEKGDMAKGDMAKGDMAKIRQNNYKKGGSELESPFKFLNEKH